MGKTPSMDTSMEDAVDSLCRCLMEVQHEQGIARGYFVAGDSPDTMITNNIIWYHNIILYQTSYLVMLVSHWWVFIFADDSGPHKPLLAIARNRWAGHAKGAKSRTRGAAEDVPTPPRPDRDQVMTTSRDGSVHRAVCEEPETNGATAWLLVVASDNMINNEHQWTMIDNISTFCWMTLNGECWLIVNSCWNNYWWLMINID